MVRPDIQILTIGGYGFDEATFATALVEAGVDTFVDIRRRRGLRGAKYSFLNSRRLQATLATLGIDYRHLLDLAPSAELRAQQHLADLAADTRKRDRSCLSETFRRGYEVQLGQGTSPASVVAAFGDDARVIALFCVEQQPGACHRSILADWLQGQTTKPVRHLVP